MLSHYKFTMIIMGFSQSILGLYWGNTIPTRETKMNYFDKEIISLGSPHRLVSLCCFITYPDSLFLYAPLMHPRLQGATIFTGVFKEAAIKGSGKLRRKKGRGQNSEENISNLLLSATNKISLKSEKKLALRPRV